MADNYPIVKYPEIVSKYMDNVLVDLQELPLPNEPSLEKHIFTGYKVSAVSLFIILVSYLFNLNSLIFYILLSIVGFFSIYISLDYSLRIFKKNREKLKTYRLNVNNCIEENKNRQSQKSHLLETGKVEDYKKERIKHALKNYTGLMYATFDTKKGFSESYFFPFLFKYFGNKILSFAEFSNAYPNEILLYPDFVFINESICIDIEIDEPYTLKDHSPIHFIGNNNDNERDSSIISLDWCIIRFAEEQIIFSPYESCKFIAKTIYDLTGNDQYLNKLDHFGELKPIKCWTRVEAENLSKLNYRESKFVEAYHYANDKLIFPTNYFDQISKILITRSNIEDVESDDYIFLNNSFTGPLYIYINRELVSDTVPGQTIEIDLDNYNLKWSEYSLSLISQKT